MVATLLFPPVLATTNIIDVFLRCDPVGQVITGGLAIVGWVGALSARLFGYSSWSLLLPSAVAGAATVGLLWIIVRGKAE